MTPKRPKSSKHRKRLQLFSTLRETAALLVGVCSLGKFDWVFKLFLKILHNYLLEFAKHTTHQDDKCRRKNIPILVPKSFEIETNWN